MTSKENEPSDEPAVDRELLLGDHEYDGIQEYDNPLPRWWTNIFWLSVVFAVGYVLYYHVSDRGQSVAAAYAADMAEADQRAAAQAAKEVVTEELLAKLAGNSATLATGQEVYAARCVPCHGDKGQGLVGPNLTDAYWIHGSGKLMDLYEVTSNGVAAKGMPAWNKQLSPAELRGVVSFIGTLRGTDAVGKPPEGKEVARD